MLKLVLLGALFILIAVGLISLALIAIFLLIVAFAREPSGKPFPRRDAYVIADAPSPSESDLAAFRRLLEESSRFSLTPGVLVLHELKEWPYGTILSRTTADFHGRLTYVETYRRYQGRACRVLCRYDVPGSVPSEVASAEFDVGDPCNAVYEWMLQEIAASGTHVLARDERNIFWEMRATREGAKARA